VSDDDPWAGMTTNERLFEAGVMDAFDAAIEAGDRDRAIALLGKAHFGERAAADIADAVLANPAFYGYPRGRAG